MASNRFSRLLKIFTGTDAGAGEELLQLEGRLERFAHFWTLVARHFVRNRCLIRASALAYTTLLAIIPLLAVVISISTSLLKNAGEEKFYQAIASIAPPEGRSHNPVATKATPVVTVMTNFNSAEISTNEVSPTNEIAAAISSPPTDTAINTQKEIASWLHDFVQNTQSAKLGVTGMLVFVFIAIMMLSRIEETFNDIWGVARGRNWLTRVVLYWAAITLGPLLLLTAIGLAGSAHFQAVKDYFQQMPIFGNFIFLLLPLLVLWLAFTVIYQIVPNTKVRFSAACVGGIVAGTLWHLNNVFGFLYVSRVVVNSQMYGGKIALVPVFMLSVYFSWAILLFGAQVAYAFQNRVAYLQDKLAENVNQRGREFVALRIMTLLGQRFQNALRPASIIQLSLELGVPSRLTQQILRTLTAARLVTEAGGTEAGYVPARPLDSINAHHILLALRSGSGRELPVDTAPALAEIYGEFARIEEAERVAAEKISLLALVNRSPMPAALAAPQTVLTEKKITDALVVEEISKPDEIETPRPVEQVKTDSPDWNPSEAAENPAEKKSASREVVRPEERDFPL
jgi:membrane protein